MDQIVLIERSIARNRLDKARQEHLSAINAAVRSKTDRSELSDDLGAFNLAASALIDLAGEAQ